MNIAIIGYGKMGHIIKDIAINAGHNIVLTADIVANDASFHIQDEDAKSLQDAVLSCKTQGVIEFSHPSAVLSNIKALLPLKIPMVVGTTGWKDSEEEVRALAKKTGGTLVRSSNFSIGVNMFLRIVEEAAKIMANYPEYDVATWEMHHNQKADSPSGTALEIAKRITSHYDKNSLVIDAFHTKPQATQLHVSSTRCGAVPGTHTVFFDSSADTIELTHRARNREGFARGAVRCLEKLVAGLDNKTLQAGNIYGIEDLL